MENIMLGYRINVFTVLFAVYTINKFIITATMPLSNFTEEHVLRCSCAISADINENCPVHQFDEISMDSSINNNIFGAPKHVSIDAPHIANCHIARKQCKQACATRLNLHLHYERFTPLGLMLCKQYGMSTPYPDGAPVMATATLNASMCHHHRHSARGPLQLRTEVGQEKLCCGFTEIVDELGNTQKRFGWNPDCMAQVYYLV